MCADVAVLAVEEVFVFRPYEAVEFAAFFVDDVGGECGAVVEYEAFEEGGASRDGEVAPVEGVFCEVVGHGEVEAFEECNLCWCCRGVFE